ncbi:MAG: tRNA guanosine(15) transglycosylase TgtA [Candidatus Altiarchaeota archaeon]|nr:tRNA guanosine(15) transglycosylase TgtA [Candidatus Altiarchaeota archaeon]
MRDKDVGGRIGKLNIDNKTVETPLLMPVYNPNKPLISIEELRDRFNLKALMTNSYLMLKDDTLREKVLAEGVHKYLNFDGLIATDSGSFQLMSYGSVSTTNRGIIEFQERIGSDIGSFLDIPSLPDSYKPRAAEELDTSLERAKEALNAKFVVNAGIQGSTHLDLRKKAALGIGGNFRLCAVGGIVRLMEDYRFSDLVDIIATVKENLPSDRIVHAFGLGHPMVFSLAAALGCDLFDSAAYALYAQDGRYMTEAGTKRLDNLDYLPCSCPICSKYGMELRELEEGERIKNLALHNLYISFEELNRVKQAIREGSLWELLSMRTRSHPGLFSALSRLSDHSGWLSRLDPITKKTPFYYTGRESRYRSEVVNARKRMKRVSSVNRIRLQPFGRVPVEVLDVYPFGSFSSPEGVVREDPPFSVRDIEKLRAIMEYQFGSGASDLIEDGFRIKKSRKTGRIRWIYRKKELVASVRASDHMIIPKQYLAEKLRERFKYPKLRVVIDDEAVPFVSEGKSVFARFVVWVDPDLRANDEVLVVDRKDELIRTGTLVLAPKEAIDFSRGVAVRVR